MAVIGLSQTLAKIKQASEIIQEDVKDTVEKYTLIIQREAIKNAPAAGDMLKTRHGFQKNSTGINQFISATFEVQSKGFKGTVFIESGASKLAIYIEFGTGVSAAGYVPTLPPEFQKIAMKYYINGKGTLIKQPFLLPAFFNNQIKFIKEVQSVLKSHGIETIYIP